MAPTLFDYSAKPGDLVQIFRVGYEHWAVYIGGNELVHLVLGDEDLGSFGISRWATVRQQKISEVVGRHKYEINNILDGTYEPRDRLTIVTEACRMVGQVRPYSLASKNCEHFATELRYGRPESRQVKVAEVGLGVGVAAVAGIGLAALGLFLMLKDDDEEKDNDEEERTNQRREHRRPNHRRHDRRHYQ